MKQTMTRTITTTTIHHYLIEVKNGKPEFKPAEPITVNGKLDGKQIEKVMKEKYGNTTQYTITGTETDKQTYQIDLNTFLKHAEIVEPKQSEKGNK